ncbi:MAG: hypothetical protein ACLRFN_04445 [Alphaproteobacteria bacterium]
MAVRNVSVSDSNFMLSSCDSSAVFCSASLRNWSEYMPRIVSSLLAVASATKHVMLLIFSSNLANSRAVFMRCCFIDMSFWAHTWRKTLSNNGKTVSGMRIASSHCSNAPCRIARLIDFLYISHAVLKQQ